MLSLSLSDFVGYYNSDFQHFFLHFLRAETQTCDLFYLYLCICNVSLNIPIVCIASAS